MCQFSSIESLQINTLIDFYRLCRILPVIQVVVDKAPFVTLSGDVEFDEVYVTAGHKGHPEAVKKRTARGNGANSKGLGGAVRSKRKSRRSLT